MMMREGTPPGDVRALTTSELEELVGIRLGSSKIEFVGFGKRAWRKLADGWLEYPEYPMPGEKPKRQAAPTRPDPSYVRRAEFVREIDGDSFIVRLDHGKFPVTRSTDEIEVRVHGLFCPELHEPKGEDARSLTTVTLMGAKEIVVETFRTKGGGGIGSFGRTVADVWVDGRRLADIIIAAGLGSPVDAAGKFGDAAV
jgi:hypothetical protein